MHDRAPNLQNHEVRLRWLERELGLTKAEVDELRHQASRDSSADLSLRPGGVRVSLKNLPPWVYVVAFLAIEGAVLAAFLAADK